MNMKPNYTVTHKLKEGIEVIDLWNTQVIKPGDKVIFLPYFKERGQILLKYKDIPAFQLKYPHIDKWITCAKSDVLTTAEDALKTGLFNEFGITLSDKYQPEILTPIFLSDDTCVEYYICIVSLMEDEYNIEQVIQSSPTVALSYADLDTYIVYDLITRHSLNVFKQTYSLF